MLCRLVEWLIEKNRIISNFSMVYEHYYGVLDLFSFVDPGLNTTFILLFFSVVSPLLWIK